MRFRRKPRRNLFVDRKQVRRKRLRRFSVIFAGIVVALVFFVNGGESPRSNASVEVALENSKGAQPAWPTARPAPAAFGEQKEEDPEEPKYPRMPPMPETAPLPENPPMPDEPQYPDEPPVPEAPKVPKVEIEESTVRPGQTAAALLRDHLTPLEIHEADKKSREVHSLRRIKAGRPYRLITSDGCFERFEYEIDDERILVLARGEEGVEISEKCIDYETREVLVRGVIESSLYNAVDEAGEHPVLAVRLSEIFAWDIDFVRDIRKGDSFRVLVEKRYRDGEFHGYGKIPAASFSNQGHRFNGFLFAAVDGRSEYFDEKGRSLRKAFLKAPLSFSRISSGFNMNRLHPILKVRRPHPAIDYAAPAGTPVRSVGDGRVIKAAYSRGAGRYVKVRHNSVYETAYLHLSRFARGIGHGSRVKQGQVIGYVGSTGLSTGPHLDFRMKKNGSYVNPRNIESPPCEPVPEERMDEFLAAIEPIKSRIDGGGVMHASARDARGKAMQ